MYPLFLSILYFCVVFFLSFLDEDFLGKKFWPFYFFGFYIFIVFIVLIFLPINRVFTLTSLLFILHIFSYLITYCLILRDYYMTFSILALVSAWDSHINPDSEAGGLIWVEGWYQGRYGKFHVIIYLSHILLWLLYCRKDLWTDKLRKINP